MRTFDEQLRRTAEAHAGGLGLPQGSERGVFWQLHVRLTTALGGASLLGDTQLNTPPAGGWGKAVVGAGAGKLTGKLSKLATKVERARHFTGTT